MSRRHRPLIRNVTAAAVLMACGGGQVSGDAPPAPDGDPAVFSAERAWADLEMLAALAPRQAGSEGAEAARDRILTRLGDLGIAAEVVETIASPASLGPIVLKHVVASLPGEGVGRFVLVAPYDSGRYEGVEFVGANDGASGAALLLELARLLAREDRLDYGVDLVWLEGEGRLGRGEGDERELRWLGSTSLAERWRQSRRLEGIRLLVAVNQVCDADLDIARDLNSQRTLREQFFSAARRLGRSGSFGRSRNYESVEASHLAFRAAGVRPVVAIVDTAFGEGEPPGALAGTSDDVAEHCSPESLETVGSVLREGLGAVGRRLAKIDRFARTPSLPEPAQPASETGPASEPEPEPVAEEPPPAEGS